MNETKHDDGGPTHPVPGLSNDPDFNGISALDYFAAHALQGLIAHYGDAPRHAECAYALAAAMLAEKRRIEGGAQ